MNRKAVVVATFMAMSLMAGGPALAEMDGTANEVAQPDTQHLRNYEARPSERRVNEGRAAQGRVNQNRAEQERVNRERVSQDRNRPDRREQNRLYQESLYQDRLFRDRAAQDRVNQDRFNQDRFTQDRFHRDGRWQERGAEPGHQIHRGGRLPAGYQRNYYVVDDWRGRNLYAPPHGAHWVQSGGDYVLVAIATGVILQILLSD